MKNVMTMIAKYFHTRRSAASIVLILLFSATPAFSQGTIIPFISQAFYDSSGNPVSSGKLCTYTAGTTTPAATYSDVTLATPNTNPITLNASGRPTTGAIFLSPTSYKFILLTAGSDSTCSTGTTLWTLDNISAIPQTGGNVDVAGIAGETLATGDVVYLSDGSGGNTAGRFYKADADFNYASSQAGIVGIAAAAISTGASGSIRLAGRMTGLSSMSAGSVYYVSATAGALTATTPTNSRQVGTADTTTTLLLAPNPPPPMFPLVAGGRLTATTGLPVTVADVSAATSIFYTPYASNRIALYSGTGWGLKTFSEITISLAGCTASKPYDVFLFDNAGTVASEILVWTSDTSRATGLVLQDGVLVKSGVTTRRYVGSFYCNASGGQTDSTFAKQYIWNNDNRVARAMRRIETTSSWTYASATLRQANASTANQLEVLVGQAEDGISVAVSASVQSNMAGDYPHVGIGLDSTSALATGVVLASTRVVSVNNELVAGASLSTYPGVGRHALTWLEGMSANTMTITSNSSVAQSGIFGMWRN